jgi:hypothetical protein
MQVHSFLTSALDKGIVSFTQVLESDRKDFAIRIGYELCGGIRVNLDGAQKENKYSCL